MSNRIIKIDNAGYAVVHEPWMYVLGLDLVQYFFFWSAIALTADMPERNMIPPRPYYRRFEVARDGRVSMCMYMYASIYSNATKKKILLKSRYIVTLVLNIKIF